MKVKTRRKNRTFSREFKEEAVSLALKLGNSEAARQLDVNETSIRNWKKKLSGVPSEPAKAKSYCDLEKENRRLKKELGYMKEINKVLKKSTAIFSQDQMGSF